MKQHLATALLLAAALTLCAAEPLVFEFRSLADWARGTKNVALLPDGTWEITGGSAFEAAKSFKVDPEKPVTVSFEIRRLPGTPNIMAYVGFWTMDADRVRIQPYHMRCEYNGDTEVLADAPVGATALRVRKPRRFVKSTWLYLAAGDIAGCKVPQFDLIQLKPRTAEVKDQEIVLTLLKPLEKAIPAGAKFHFHGDGPGMYVVCNEKNPSEEWEKITCVVKGMQPKFPTPRVTTWWHGTVYAKLRVIIAQGKRDKVQIRNIRVEVAR